MIQPFPKAERVEDPKYLEHLRGLRCSFCPRGPRSQAHHVLPKGMGGATLRDDLACSTCQRCHMRCHGLVVEGRGPILLVEQLAAADRQRAAYLKSRAPTTTPPVVPW